MIMLICQGEPRAASGGGAGCRSAAQSIDMGGSRPRRAMRAQVDSAGPRCAWITGRSWANTFGVPATMLPVAR